MSYISCIVISFYSSLCCSPSKARRSIINVGISHTHTRIDTVETDIYRRIDEVQQELIRENASILKTVKSR
jgi:hypothetical protein